MYKESTLCHNAITLVFKIEDNIITRHMYIKEQFFKAPQIVLSFFCFAITIVTICSEGVHTF